MSRRNVSSEIERYFRAVERVADDPEFQQLIVETVENPELAPLVKKLSDPSAMQAMRSDREAFIRHAAREKLQKRVEDLMADGRQPSAASWFVTSADGLQIASVFEGDINSSSLGQNFAWRTYFHGGRDDLPKELRPPEVPHVPDTSLSALYQSSATNAWKVAVSTPVIKDGKFLGIVGMSIEMGNIIHFQGNREHAQFAVLLDQRSGTYKGAILQHPLLESLRRKMERVPDRFSEYRVELLPVFDDPRYRYRDPLGSDENGSDYKRDWIVATAPVMWPGAYIEAGDMTKSPETGLVVMIQEDFEAAAAPSHALAWRLAREGLWALGIVAVVVFRCGSLWSAR